MRTFHDYAKERDLHESGNAQEQPNIQNVLSGKRTGQMQQGMDKLSGLRPPTMQPNDWNQSAARSPANQQSPQELADQQAQQATARAAYEQFKKNATSQAAQEPSRLMKRMKRR